MILVDADILVTSLRIGDPKVKHLLATLFVGICGVTRAELYRGVRTPHKRAKVNAALGPLGCVPIPDAIWDEVGDNGSKLLRRGVSVPFNDVVVATVAIDSGLEVWSRDAHFPMMQPHLPGLRLFVEPP